MQRANRKRAKQKWIIRCHICRAKLSLLCCWVHASNNCNGMCLYIKLTHIRIGCLIARRPFFLRYYVVFYWMEILECTHKEIQRERTECTGWLMCQCTHHWLAAILWSIGKLQSVDPLNLWRYLESPCNQMIH